MTLESLADAARQAALMSYCPYSNFRVGAVAVDDQGNIYTGANVENASYPVSTCAEATVIAHAVSQGARRLPTVAVACIDAVTVEDAYPCGRCRQIMNEFGVEDVYVTAGEGEVRHHTLQELFPHGFRLHTPVEGE
jgi:cytidine deaminase